MPTVKEIEHIRLECMRATARLRRIEKMVLKDWSETIANSVADEINNACLCLDQAQFFIIGHDFSEEEPHDLTGGSPQ